MYYKISYNEPDLHRVGQWFQTDEIILETEIEKSIEEIKSWFKTKIPNAKIKVIELLRPDYKWKE